MSIFTTDTLRAVVCTWCVWRFSYKTWDRITDSLRAHCLKFILMQYSDYAGKFGEINGKWNYYCPSCSICSLCVCSCLCDKIKHKKLLQLNFSLTLLLAREKSIMIKRKGISKCWVQVNDSFSWKVLDFVQSHNMQVFTLWDFFFLFSSIHLLLILSFSSGESGWEGITRCTAATIKSWELWVPDRNSELL